MYAITLVEGAIYSNRVRTNLHRIMEERGMAGVKGLPHMSQSGLYKFLSGKGDITLFRLEQIADDLAVSIFDLLKVPDEA